MTQKVVHFAFPHCAHGVKNGLRNIPSPGLHLEGFLFVCLSTKGGLGVKHKCEPPDSICEALIQCCISWASCTGVWRLFLLRAMGAAISSYDAIACPVLERGLWRKLCHFPKLFTECVTGRLQSPGSVV